MDKIQKALNKLSVREREQIKTILKQIKYGKIENLDIKKLKGRDDIYRVRKGRTRILYKINPNGDVSILVIERRSDTTYNL